MGLKFKCEAIIPASPADVYASWLDGKTHAAMTGAHAEGKAQVGTIFQAWDGYIHGRNLELVENQKIVQSWRTSEFSEVFFDGAQTAAENIVGGEGNGWKVAMGTLAFERGVSTLGQQHAFTNELNEIIKCAQQNGSANDPLIRQKLAEAWVGLKIMRYNALRTLSGSGAEGLPKEALISKLYWSNLHQKLGELAMEVLGPDAEITEGAPYKLNAAQRLFLFTRADTIYAGSNEIQRNIIAERGLGMPREPRPTKG